MTSIDRRLIEVAFPLKQTSLDSVHEKNVRHGHISTLHIWPARRPLAACRAALIATLLPDPGDPEKRQEILDRLAGKVVEVRKKKRMPSGQVEEVTVEETVGGILHWGRESGPDLEWFRQEIRKAYGGRAPRVLDPFAGGGAIPLEAMRLGCEATAMDINPVAWFILKCTLEYPQKLAGQTRPLPAFVLRDREFMESFFKAQGLKGKTLKGRLEELGLPHAQTSSPVDAEKAGGQVGDFQARLLDADVSPVSLEADVAWHVRAWGRWVLQQAKADLGPYYPVVDGKPTLSYLWARTVSCKACRAATPLLKTRWLCRKDNKRVLLTMEPNPERTGVIFGIQNEVPVVGTNAAQRREHDKRIAAGTMSHSGALCPCCATTMTSDDLRFAASSGRMSETMTAVVVEGAAGKEYRLPRSIDKWAAAQASQALDGVYAGISHGLPTESVPHGGSRAGGGSPFTVHLYGLDRWHKLFTSRQLLSHGVFIRSIGCLLSRSEGPIYDEVWRQAVYSYLACVLSKVLDYGNVGCSWYTQNEQVTHLFNRFAVPIKWDFAETSPIGGASGSWESMLQSVAKSITTSAALPTDMLKPAISRQSAIGYVGQDLDLVVTDPPYYDAIPYSDTMDFFYVWLRRVLSGVSSDIDGVFASPLSPKWSHEDGDGELIDDPSRFGGDGAKSRAAYEDGLYRAFRTWWVALNTNGRVVVVFANKQPDAWESLVSAIIRAGFAVDGSWPIQTEMGNRTRAISSSALASSVWLVCKKRPATAHPGWDNRVLEEMRVNIKESLHRFWDAGIRGPDFVWAATGPALEAYSKYPAVKKADAPNERMSVSEFLRQVRRIVVDFAVGRVLSHNGGEGASGLDDVTTYYLLHRSYFKMDDAPSGACILYAVSCGLSDVALADQYDLLVRTGGQEAAEVEVEPESDDGEAEAEGSGSKVRLKAWQQRRRASMGHETQSGRPAPLIDQAHRLMHFWKAGKIADVNEYVEERGLRRNALFGQLLQALIELAPRGSDERALLESISNHLAGTPDVAGRLL